VSLFSQSVRKKPVPDRLYLDHAATTPMTAAARAAVAEGMARWANPSSPHAEGRAARAALEEVLAKHPQFVMATSGSIVTEAATLERLLSSCFTVWLRAEPAEHMQRVMSQGDMRPMAHSPRAMADLLSILDSRKPLYAKADIAISTTDKTPDQALAELLHAVTVPDNRISRRSA
jgi:hypothetical protein